MAPSLLFDLDGTLADTDATHFAAFGAVFADYGVTLSWDAYRTQVMGVGNREIAARFLGHVPPSEHGTIMDRKEAVYRTLVTHIEPVPGLMALLDWADAEAIPCAVVTNAPRASANLVLKALGIGDRFHAIVFGTELPYTKPHPLPYLEALRLVGARAENSVAFEDSGSGIAAALAAGLPVIGMTTSLEAAAVMELGATLAARDLTDAAIVHFVRQRTRQG